MNQMLDSKLQTAQRNQIGRSVKNTVLKDKKFASKNASGSGFFAYVSIKAEPCDLEGRCIVIEEKLTNKDKIVIEMLEIIPQISKAIFDYCADASNNRKPIVNTKFTIEEMQYSLVDFKPFRYYQCTQMILNEIFSE